MKKLILSAIMLIIAVLSANAQEITVKGCVVSATDSEPLIGASVISSANYSTGTSTDIDGNFTLKVKEGTSLTISYVGYKTTTVKAQPEMLIRLSEDSEILD